MNERNDEALNRAAHGRASFGAYDPTRGMEQYVTEMSTPLGRVALVFENQRRVRVSVCHSEAFFRSLEAAWNEFPDLGETDVHAKFQKIAEEADSPSFEPEQKCLMVGEFLHKAASALEALSDGQQAEIASLEEHARQIHLTYYDGKEAL